MSAYCYCNIGLHLWIVTAVLVLLTVDVHQVASAQESRKANSSKILSSFRDGSKLEETSSTGKGFPQTFVALKESGPQDAGSEGSATRQKTTRQIFSEDEPRRGSRGQQQPSSREQLDGRSKDRNKPREEFSGFPEDFTDGLKLFEFQENSKQKPASSSGFVDYPKDGGFSSFASQLGGLQPFPPLSLSSSTTRGRTSPTSGSATRGSQFSADDVSSTSTGGHANSFQPDRTHKLPRFEAEEDFGDGGTGRQRFSSQEDDDGRFPQRSTQRQPKTEFRDDFSLDDGQDVFNEGKGSRGRHAQSSVADEKPVRAPSSDNDFSGFGDELRSSLRNQELKRRPITNEDFEPFDQRFDADPDTFSRPSKSSDDFATSGRLSSSEDDRRVQFPKRFQDEQEDRIDSSSISSAKTSTLPTSNFRDLNQFQLTSSQNFLPVAQFHNGPFPFPQQFGGFQPIHNGAQSPPVRNFRHVAPPQFYITSGGQFDGNNFFENGGGSPPDFGQGPSQAAPNFNRPQQDFRQQRFHFQHQHQQPSHQSHRTHQRPQQQNNFHSDDTTTHHSSATNLLGSGNFGIIRGGIFADDENPPQSFRPQFHGNHHGGGNSPEDFFHGFRDFQPFGGPLNNALSVNSQNIQNAGTKTETVTAKSETDKPATTKKSV